MDENIRELFAAIDICHANEMTIPTAALIYVAIDTLGWMKYGAIEKSSRKRFTQWCEEYINDFFDENCNATDLYSARCATLHSISVESSLSSSGQARKILYASGKDSEDIPSISNKILSKVNTTCIHIDSLINQLKIGASIFFDQNKSCEQSMETIDQARKKQFVKIPTDLFKKILPLINNL
ncbi:hypothetical protein [Stutzerimonas nitrititolerans]|uniref:hypothetical protein n=1 Tax=Stutzerimonas nitrititolerans TaxID=2482751 RepID=UPI00128FABA6|nr:hypothetical protein [Stutzerimonas nitrititolerans]